MKLLDSNVLIHFVKGRPAVVSRLLAENPQTVAVPAIVAYELEYGMLKSARSRTRAVVSRLLAEFEHVPFDRAAAHEAARLRVDLESKGSVIGSLDLLIAGTALSLGAVLATSNVKEFSRIRDLRIEDWSA
ncbi:MAG TPA: type II toxin-antitoxin system VapC family toxin [Bryobacteraceae bacterium]|jgi:tRNA(fMet)-specific endonuclease VapC|nr:type II toxin-antitoxin system VapC family toxin [Bryobacteraceae bacterium]